MSWLLAITFFVLGWLLIAEFDQSFFGFLLVTAGVLSLFVGKSKSREHAIQASQVGGYPYQQPIIVKSGGHGSQYQQIKMRIHDPWDSAKNYEDTFVYFGDLVLWPFKVLWRLLRMGKGK